MAVPGKVINISYDEMKELYGEDIFGYMQPKRALDCISAQLYSEYGITMNIGKRVKHNSIPKNGLGILKKSSEDTKQMSFD
ncbi:MAG: hypothetical protein II996_00730 [Oscillospiraceae bacterium]|nr:hypothetical protein [Oscillospiraceae bacterium]